MSFLKSFNQLFETAPLKKTDVVFKKHPRARSYLAKVDSSAQIVVTIPIGGTKRDALVFANSHHKWLKEQQGLALDAISSAPPIGLKAGDTIWFRGSKKKIRVEKDWGRPVAILGDQRIFIADEEMDLRLPVLKHLRKLAKNELSEKVKELADRERFRYKRVTVRDQKTRWGSCSITKTISLSWRLILVPPATRDYVILHELAHLRRFDHSRSFWKLVESLCPDYRVHEAWLDSHQNELIW